MKLYDFQEIIVQKIREAVLSGKKRICVQLVTGGGKTVIFTSILSALHVNKKISWLVVPRIELLSQTSEHLLKWKTPHGRIDSNNKENSAFTIHVVSRETLLRRIKTIKNKPDYIFFDECHIALDQQLKIVSFFPDATIISFTATPERADGRGLSELYECLIEGPSIPELTERVFISPIKYFSPPIIGLNKIKRNGIDYDEIELEQLFEKRKIYGGAINHYKNYANYKSALVFCRSVKSAYETADRFNDAGYKFLCIEGKQSDKERSIIINALRDKKIHGITNCDLATYGLDIKNIEVIIMLRPTTSKSLYFQMIGRGLRTHSGKEFLTVMDHVGNLFEHQEPENKGVPLHYLNHIHWNFDGIKKRESNKSDERLTSLKLCPNCYLYFEGLTCPNCGTSCQKQREELKKVEAELVEIIPVPLADRPYEEKKEYIDRIEKAVAECSLQILPGAVGEMLAMSRELGYPPMWVYHKLNQNKVAVNVPLLSEISRQCSFKHGWVWVQREKLKGRIK